MGNDLMPSSEELKNFMVLAQKAKDSPFFTKLGGEGGILSIMLYARELGLPPMQCLFGGMYNIQNTVTLSARMMNSMIRKAGHIIEKLECTNKLCRLKGTRTDIQQPSEIEEYTIQDAELAGSLNKDNWRKTPSDMLYARCLSRLARRLFPDVIGTAYVEGEIPEDENIITTVAVEDSPPEIYVDDITLEKATEELSQATGLENNETLSAYILKAQDVMTKSLRDTVITLCQNKDRVIERYNSGLQRQEPKENS